MGRLIKIAAGSLPQQLDLAIGDLLCLPVSGVQILDGGDCLQLIGPLIPAAVGLEGTVVTPAAMPNVVFVLALAPGCSTLSLAVGRELAAPVKSTLVLRVVTR